MTALRVLNWDVLKISENGTLLQASRETTLLQYLLQFVASFGGQVTDDSDDLLARKPAFCMPCNEGTDLPVFEVSFGQIAALWSSFGWAITGFRLLVTCLHT